MSFKDNQRAPNVSEFIANLNAIPSDQDLAAQQQDFNFDDDLAMFTNTTFFDFDLGQDADLNTNTQRFGEQLDFNAQLTNEPTATPDMAKANMDFLQGKFQFFNSG